MNAQILESPSQSKVDELKAAIKETGIPASVKVQKNIKGVYGSISIRPTKATKWNWTEKQTLQMITLVRSLGFYVREYEFNSYVYNRGLTYLMIITQPTPGHPAVRRRTMTNSTNHRDANSIIEMQEIAQNQLQAKIHQLQERIEWLKQISVTDVVDWESYQRATADVNEFGDDADLTALKELGEYYETMEAGHYF